MSRGRLLARNTLLNLASQAAPAAVAVVAVPFLIHGLGTARFGILTLAWTAIGYFGLFDLGLGRALTHAVAVRLGASDTDDLGEVAWTALILMLGLGVVAGVLVAAFTPLLAGRVLNIPPELRSEAAGAFYLLALSLPVTLMTSGLRGLLEAHQDFGLATALRLPLGAFNFLGPLLVLPFSHGLVPTVAVLVVGRYIGWILHLAVCVRRYGFMGGRIALERSLVPSLVRIGGWMTVSNIVSPLMVNIDRFLIGALLSVAAVAYYVTPYEVVTKLFLFPGSLLGVLFPAFAESYATDRGRTGALMERGVRIMIATVFPFTLVCVALSHEGLRLWLGDAFASESAPVLQWLAVGVFINCVGQVAFASLQGIGRPDLTGKVHLVEIPLYAAAIVLLAHAFGLVGIAMAWVLRIAADTVVLLVLNTRYLPEARGALARSGRVLVLLVIVEAAAGMAHTTTSRLLLLAIVLPLYAAYGWMRLLHGSERDALRRWLGVGERPFSPIPAAITAEGPSVARSEE